MTEAVTYPATRDVYREITAASKASQARDYLGSFERQAQTIIVRHDPETVLSGDMKGSGSDASTMD